MTPINFLCSSKGIGKNLKLIPKNKKGLGPFNLKLREAP
ncbi:hypothetical protein KBTX_04425 [wastewater metagenome]|uniref:Uncharacterized protein n=2 Tax=unclassified sequences TaxID=12908 RepID=A0A5B8RLX5_9ZZZZ|nr:hypothetical protein KBTEX_04425 [uncultured organism]